MSDDVYGGNFPQAQAAAFERSDGDCLQDCVAVKDQTLTGGGAIWTARPEDT